MKKPAKKIPPIKVETEINTVDALCKVIEAMGPKRLLNYVGTICFRHAMEKCQFPTSMFANEKDEEKADVAAAICYLNHNFDEVSKKGMKILKEKLKEGNKKQESEKSC